MSIRPLPAGGTAYWLDRRSNLLLLCAIPYLQNTAVNGTIPMVSYKALDFGASPAQIGVIGAAFTFLSFLVAIPSGRLVDRWGSPLFITAGCGLILLAELILISTGNLVVLGIGQMILGLGFVLCVIGTQTFLANNGDPAERDRLFGTYTVTMLAGSISGPLMVGLLAGQLDLGANAVFATAAVVKVVALGISLLLWHADTGRERRQASDGPAEPTWPALRRVVRNATFPQAVLVGVIIAICGDIIVVFLPVFGEEQGIPVGTVALLLTAMSAASIFARFFLMPLLRRMGRRKLLASSMLLPAVTLVLTPFAGGTALLFVLLCAAGFGLGIGPPLSLTWVSWAVAKRDLGFAFGIRQSANRGGQMLVTAVIGGIAGLTGMGAVFVTLGLLLGGGAVLARDTPVQEPEQ